MITPVMRLLMNPAFLPLLLDATVKCTLLLALAALLAQGQRKSSAAVRHLTWLAALLGAMVLPLLSTVLPVWSVPALPAWWPAVSLPADSAPALNIPPVEQSQVTSSAVVVNVSNAAGQPDARQADTAKSTGAITIVPAKAATPQISARHFFLQDFLKHFAGLIWFMGVGAALLPLLAGFWQVWRLTRRCSPMTGDEWQFLLDDTAASLRLRRPVRLLSSPAVKLPMTWGAWRPVLLLPESARDWPTDRRRMVLLHELAHVQRWDWLTQIIAYAACAIFWYNPLAWHAARRMRLEREQACDDLVLRGDTRPSDYAGELLQLAASHDGRGLIDWATVPMARRSALEGRLLAILDARRNRAGLTRVGICLALVLAAAVTIPLAIVRGQEAAQTATTPDKVVPARAVTVTGMVKNPGPVTIPAGEALTAMDAIDEAGGSTLSSGGFQITISRKTANGTITIPVLHGLWANGGTSVTSGNQFILIEAGDVVNVGSWGSFARQNPITAQTLVDEGVQDANAQPNIGSGAMVLHGVGGFNYQNVSVAHARPGVPVLGWVKNGGEMVEIPEGKTLTVMEAIMAAGGPRSEKYRAVVVTRRPLEGLTSSANATGVKVINVAQNKMMEATFDFQLAAGDQVVVGEVSSPAAAQAGGTTPATGQAGNKVYVKQPNGPRQEVVIPADEPLAMQAVIDASDWSPLKMYTFYVVRDTSDGPKVVNQGLEFYGIALPEGRPGFKLEAGDFVEGIPDEPVKPGSASTSSASQGNQALVDNGTLINVGEPYNGRNGGGGTLTLNGKTGSGTMILNGTTVGGMMTLEGTNTFAAAAASASSSNGADKMTAAPTASKLVKLSSLDLSAWEPKPGAPTYAWGNEGRHSPALKIGGEEFADGVSMIANGALYLNLAGGSDTFTATIGMDGGAPPAGADAPVSAVFRVLGDGKVLYESKPKQRGGAPEKISVDAQGIKTLALDVRVQGEYHPGNMRDADWADATFEVTGAQPQAVAAPAATVLPPGAPGQLGLAEAFIVQGNVTLIDAEGQATPLVRGTPGFTAEGKTIQTGTGGQALIVFSNGATIKLLENTTLKVTLFRQAPFDEGADGTFLRLSRDPSRSNVILECTAGHVEGEVKQLDKAAGSTFRIYLSDGVSVDMDGGTFGYPKDTTAMPVLPQA